MWNVKPRQEGWVVAATPPTPSRSVLAYYPDGEAIHLMHYAFGQWWKDSNHTIGTNWPAPSHWRYLPAPPDNLEEERRQMLEAMSNGTLETITPRMRYLMATGAGTPSRG